MLTFFLLAGVISSGDEDEAKGSTQATDGEVPRRGRAGLRGCSQVRVYLSNIIVL